LSIQTLLNDTLIVGTTGACKTRASDLLVTQAELPGEAVIIIDPKGDMDLMASAKRACQSAQRPDRFFYFHPAYPEDNVRLDPLHNFNRPRPTLAKLLDEPSTLVVKALKRYYKTCLGD